MQTYPHTKRKKLKPAGHSATIEALIQPAIVVGSTLMSAIAAYVLAYDEITRILDGTASPADYFITALCAGMGFLIDMAIIVAASRYKMHAVRNDPREHMWRTLAKWVLGIGLTSETLTLFYFFVHLSPQAFPGWMIALANLIHSILAAARAFLPPIIIAYFVAGILPVMFDRADRNREIKSRTSSNIMLLIDKLSEVWETDDKAEMLRALGGQLMLDTYATYDETARTTEAHQLQRDAKLLAHLARIHRLDWSEIAADVAPELTARTAVAAFPAQDAGNPDDKPTPPPGPRGGTPRPAPLEHAGVTMPQPYYVPEGDTSLLNAQESPAPEARVRKPRAPKAPQARNLTRLRNDSRTYQDVADMGFGLLNGNPDLTQAELRDKLNCRAETAQRVYAAWKLSQPAREERAVAQ